MLYLKLEIKSDFHEEHARSGRKFLLILVFLCPDIQPTDAKRN